MRLDRLRPFVVLAEELHFGRAAARLRLSQPALTLQLQNLEGELGLTLIRRTRRRAELTAAGRQFLAEAKLALHHAEQAAARARIAAAGDVGTLAIGFSVDHSQGVLPALIAGFQSAYPGLRLSSRLEISADLPPLVVGRVLDIAFVTTPLASRPAELEAEDLWSARLVAVLPEGHRFAKRRALDLKELREERFVMTPVAGWTGFYQQVARALDAARFAPNVVHEVLDATMVAGLVAEGLGVSVLSEGSAPRLPGVVAVPLAGPLATVTQSAIWRRDNDSPVLANFIAAVRTRTRSGLKPPRGKALT